MARRHLFVRPRVHTVAQDLKENNVLVRRQLPCKWTYTTWLLDWDTSVLRTSEQLNASMSQFITLLLYCILLQDLVSTPSYRSLLARCDIRPTPLVIPAPKGRIR
jgi:hypothetical protein